MRAVIRAGGGGVVGLLGVLLAGCGGTLESAPGDSGGGAGTSTGGQPAAGSGGAGPSGCYSPTQNLPFAYQPSSHGCPCGVGDADVCVGGVALICSGSSWQAVEDGPCGLSPSAAGSGGASPASGGASPASAGAGGASPASGGAGGATATVRFSPTSCKEAGGLAVPSKGGQQTPETDCDSGVALGAIDAASSGWDEGGLCCAIGKDPLLRACGARAGNACSATEFCAYEASQVCGAADAEAVCQPRPDNCIQLYARVCGCDRKTYGNSCLANAAGTGIYKAGTCD